MIFLLFARLFLQHVLAGWGSGGGGDWPHLHGGTRLAAGERSHRASGRTSCNLGTASSLLLSPAKGGLEQKGGECTLGRYSHDRRPSCRHPGGLSRWSGVRWDFFLLAVQPRSVVSGLVPVYRQQGTKEQKRQRFQRATKPTAQQPAHCLPVFRGSRQLVSRDSNMPNHTTTGQTEIGGG